MAQGRSTNQDNVVRFVPRDVRRKSAEGRLPCEVSRLPVTPRSFDWSGPSYHEAAIRDEAAGRNA